MDLLPYHLNHSLSIQMNPSTKMSFRKINITTSLLLKDALLLFSNRPDLLNTLSLGTDDPPTHKIALATSTSTDIKPYLLFHQSKVSPVICTVQIVLECKSHSP